MNLGQIIQAEQEFHKTTTNSFRDFPAGVEVLVVSYCVDFRFFRPGCKGVVKQNSENYLGIIVQLTNCVDHEGKLLTWNFNPQDLKVLSKEQPNEEIFDGVGCA